jgi:type I restriction enzyme S subunit
MSQGWPLVPLGEILKSVSRAEQVDSNKTYKILGAHWYAQGLYIKDVKGGGQIQAEKIYRVEENDFVYNRLFAWKGSFAVASKLDNDCYVSNEFPCFKIETSRMERKYLEYYFKQEKVWDEALSYSTGSTPTSRNRLKEEALLLLLIPLPPLDEQRRIVARIDALAERIAEARRLRAEVVTNAEVMLNQQLNSIIRDKVEWKTMREVAPLVRRPIEIDLSQKYHELGIRSFGKGTFHKPPIEGVDLGTKKIFRIFPGDLLFNIVFAWEGAVAIVQPEDEGRVGSHRFLTCVANDEEALAPFLCSYFLSEHGLQKLREASPGGAGRNRTLGIESLAKIFVPIPPLAAQRFFVGLLNKVDTLKTEQATISAELDALLPAILDRAFRGEL